MSASNGLGLLFGNWELISLPTISLLVILGVAGLSLYRLYFSPLARFPGPKLAAATQWYEFYWNIIRPGQFIFHLQDLHDRYGPIVRINPWELHIRDPEFYDTIYDARGSYRNKVAAHTHWSNNPLAAHGTVDHNHHKIRRNAMNPFFSKKQVQIFSPYIQACVDKLIWRMATEYKGTKKQLSLGNALGCLTGDVVMEFCFAKNYNLLSLVDFKSKLLEAIHHLEASMHPLVQFPFLLPLSKSLPDRFLPDPIKQVLGFKKEMRTQVIDLIGGRNQGYMDATNATVFKELLDSDLPTHEKSVERLEEEGLTIIGAGQTTVQNALVVALFYLLENPSVWQKLREELVTIFPDPSTPPELPSLKQLPYLTAVIQESLRLSYGTVTRLPRAAPTILEYGEYSIPANTPISTNHYCSSHDEILFPNSHSFIPERWMDNPRAPVLNTPSSTIVKDSPRPLLSKYLVVFTKGPRMCPGMHLAWAELYIGLANIVRRCDLELFETTYEDVGFVTDMVVPHPKSGSKGLRVLVKDVVLSV